MTPSYNVFELNEFYLTMNEIASSSSYFNILICMSLSHYYWEKYY